MPKPFILYGWKLSFFTAKAATYLRYKKIPFTDKPISLFDLHQTIPKNCRGAKVMPVLVTPEGEWIQDTRVIMDRLEERFPTPSIFPIQPKKRFVSILLETWCDEFWIPPAMFLRWNYAENIEFFKNEAGQYLLPWAPRFVQHAFAGTVIKVLKGFLPYAGVRPHQHEMLHVWTRDILGKLDHHFSQHPYLLGAHPSIGDFGLAGPLVAHLGRDPWPKANVTDPLPHLTSWIKRISTLNHEEVTADLKARGIVDDPSDTIPPSLIPVLDSVFHDFIPYLEAVADKSREVEPKFTASNRPLPRILGDIEIPLGASRYQRNAMTFPIWKAQKLLDEYKAMDAADQAEVSKFVTSFPNGSNLLNLRIPRVERIAQRVKVITEGKSNNA